MLQISLSVAGPSHPRPSPLPPVHFRSRDMMPAPHVWLHLDQADQVPQVAAVMTIMIERDICTTNTIFVKIRLVYKQADSK